MMEDRTPAETVLIVEDDASLLQIMVEVLDSQGYRPLASPEPRTALELLQTEPVDLVVTDLAMPGMRGERLLAESIASFPEIPVIAITAFGSLQEAVALTRAGAADYLTKPFGMQELLAAVARALDESRPRREKARSLHGFGKDFEAFVGPSRPMIQLFERISRVAASHAPVLITGETGTGKELVAQAIHRISGRDPFIPVNCGAIPDHLLESELFGHVRGAFTGADRDKVGLFEEAHGGTLFLDEVAELPLALQPKLLRALQSGELRRLGEVRAHQVQVRLIAATHRDLLEKVAAGEFREDLLYRINVLQVPVPALRERPTDIPLLAERFLTLSSRREGHIPRHFSPAALAALVAYSWPGNVRQLMNVVESAAVLSERPEIDLKHLPEEIRSASKQRAVIHAAADRALTLHEVEREYTLEILRRHHGNKSRAADVLGIPRRTLYRRLEEWGGDRPV